MNYKKIEKLYASSFLTIKPSIFKTTKGFEMQRSKSSPPKPSPPQCPRRTVDCTTHSPDDTYSKAVDYILPSGKILTLGDCDDSKFFFKSIQDFENKQKLLTELGPQITQIHGTPGVGRTTAFNSLDGKRLSPDEMLILHAKRQEELQCASTLPKCNQELPR